MASGRRYFLPSQYWPSDEPVKVDEIRVAGTPYTQQDVFFLYVNEARNSRTANELHSTLLRARQSLMDLGIFRSIQFVVDAARQERTTSITVVAEEIPRKEYGVGLGGGGSDQRLVLTGSLAILNMFGRGEHFRSTVSYAAPGFAEYSTMDSTLSKPLLFVPSSSPPQFLTAKLRFTSVSHARESRHHAMSGVGEVGYKRGDVSWTIGHETRRLSPLARASFANIQQGGWSSRLFGSLKWTKDTLDNALLPMEGYKVHMGAELNADPRAARLLFARLEAHALLAYPIAMIGGSAQLRLRIGHLLPLSSSESSPCYNSLDAYHLGGGATIPGFHSRGVARSDSLESLGFGSYWLSSIHYTRNIPHVPNIIAAHIHASACGVSNVIGKKKRNHDDGDDDGLISSHSLRASVGVGIVLALPGTGRISLTWSKVLMQQQNDALSRFIQLAFTTSFD